jgi:ankyrin repeat protein
VFCGGFFAFVLLLANGETPLHASTHRDDLAETLDLIRRGANVNAASDLGVTPLWNAVLNGNEAIVRALLAAGADPNRALLRGETPLMLAARSGYANIAEQLLAKGASPDARGPREQTALMWAAAGKHPGVVRVLLARGASVHLRSATWSQMMAVPPHGYRGYNKMIPHGGQTALLFAAREGDAESVRLLLAAGARVNDADAWGVTALVFAAHSGFTELVELLLTHEADPNLMAAGFSALHLAIARRDERMARALLVRGADANAPLKTWTPTRRSSNDFHFEPELVGAAPFWMAARFLQPSMMRLLLAHGADAKFVHRAVSVTGNTFRQRTSTATALMAAAGLGAGRAWVEPPRAERPALALEAARIALAQGVDPRVKNEAGQTALDGARAAGNRALVEFLAGLP